MEMDPLLHLRYTEWANALVLDALKQLPASEYEKERASSFTSIKATLEHTFRADAVWFARVAGEPFTQLADIQIPATLAELTREWLALSKRWQDWVGQLSSNQLGIEIRYVSGDGASHQTPLWQILLHLVNHGSYHRGQVASMMRQAGVKPPTTDLIVFYRSLGKQAAGV